MIDGLKLTLTDEELKAQLANRIRAHESRVEWCEQQLERDVEDQTEDNPLLPGHMLEHSRDEHRERIYALTLIHDHLEAGEVYRLSRQDLQFERPAAGT